MYDDSAGDAGSVAGGWRLTLTTLAPPICCGGNSLADMSVGAAASVPTIGIGSNITYTINVTNLGPNTASDVLFTDTLPTNVSFVSVTSNLGNPTNINGVITCSFGTMTVGAQANLSIVVTTVSAGYATNTATVSARTPAKDLVMSVTVRRALSDMFSERIRHLRALLEPGVTAGRFFPVVGCARSKFF